MYSGLSGPDLIKAIQANNGLSMVGANGNVIPASYKPSVVAQTVQSSAPKYDGYGNGLIQSPNADSYYEMSGQLTKPDWSSGQIAPQTPKQTSYLGDAWDSAKDAGKSLFSSLSPTSAVDTYAKQRADWLAGVGKDYVAPTIKDGIMTSAGSGTSFDDYLKQTQAQQGINNQQWATGVQAGLGGVNAILGAMSYFDNKAINKKNMALIDQQIANNQDVMRTRTERAGDIKEFFGKKV